MHETVVETKNKPNQQQGEQKATRKVKRPAYAPIYMDEYRIIPKLSEFINMLSKEQIIAICFSVDEFNKHKEDVNIKYKEEHKRIKEDPSYKEFLLFKKDRNDKQLLEKSQKQDMEEFPFSTISTSKVFEEKMTLEDQIFFELTGMEEESYDEFGLPYYYDSKKS